MSTASLTISSSKRAKCHEKRETLIIVEKSCANLRSHFASSALIRLQRQEQKLNSGSEISEDLIESYVTKEIEQWNANLNDILKSSKVASPPSENLTFKGVWKSYDIVSSKAIEGLNIFNTGVDVDKLKSIGQAAVALPTDRDFKCHPTIERTMVKRRPVMLKEAETAKSLDWAAAESLAVGSLLSEGHHVRISGQDVGRGTFSHRHFMFVDQNDDSMWVPFNSPIHGWKGRLEVANSLLSESAVLGFEIGMSCDDPSRLVIWEAQFGDFFNGAQIQIDTYVGSTETKWNQQCGLVIVLPHGYDGAGPEHSSCRLERWLQLTDSIESPHQERVHGTLVSKASSDGSLTDTDAVNLHVVAPTTPAQYFHLLRRQIIRPFRRPLVIVGPKAMLRLPSARSDLQDLSPETHFQHILVTQPSSSDPSAVKTVVLCAGKHYYALLDHFNENVSDQKKKEYAFVRVEQLAPFPVEELSDVLKSFKNANKYVWSQEEHRNMGAWTFVSRRVKEFLNVNLKYAGRMELACPAVGIGEIHKAEVNYVMRKTFE